MGFARIRWDSPGSAGIREDSLGLAVIREDSLGFARIPWHSPGFAGIRKYSLGFARIRWDSLRFVRIRLDLPGFLRIRWCCDSPIPQTSAARERSEGAERLRSCRLLVCRGLQSYLLKLFSFHCEIPWLGSDYRTNKHKRTTRCLYPSCSFYEINFEIRSMWEHILTALPVLCSSGFFQSFFRSFFRSFFSVFFGDVLDGFGRHFGVHFR